MIVQTLTASVARQQWAQTFDEAFYEGPKFIEKNNRINLLVNVQVLVDSFTVSHPICLQVEEENGEVMASIKGLDEIFGHGDSVEEAVNDLADFLEVYCPAYFESLAKHSKKHFPYVLQLAVHENKTDLVKFIRG